MAERKSGPVKPPVIDLTARPAKAASDDKKQMQSTTTPAAEKLDTQPNMPPKTEPDTARPRLESSKPEAVKAESYPSGPKAAEPQPQTVTAPPMRAQNSWLYAGLGAIAGAILGTGLTYGLASAGYFPSAVPAIDNPAPQLADQANHIASLESRFNDATGGLKGQLVELAKSVDAQKAAITALQSAKPAAVDLAPVDARLKTLSDRVEAIAAGASSADAGALAANLATLQKSVSDLGAKVTSLADAQAAIDSKLGGVSGEIATTKSALAQQAAAAQASATTAAAQLPMALSGLENAFSVGRPYAAELASLRTLKPDVAVPATVSEHAETGLVRPDDLAARFTTALPDILAAEPVKPDTGWQDAAMNWAKTVLALRPAGEISGNGPQAVTSRLEAAINRHDFAGAAALFAALPEPMRAAAKTLPQDVAAQADAQKFLAEVRGSAVPAGAGASK